MKAKTMRQWYRIVAQADGTAADLFVFDEIGKSFWNDEAVTAQRFIDEIRALPESVITLRVHVNSPGGSVFEAITIANALRAESRDRNRTVEMSIEGLAASAATIITSSGDSIKIADNAMMMIHDPIALVWGPAGEMRKMAEVLDQVRDSIIATYRWVSQLSAAELSDLMAATTWMSAEEAVKNGLATEVITPTAAVEDRFRPAAIAALGEIPEAYRDRIAALVGDRAAAASGDPAEAKAHPKDVVTLCQAAGLPELAASLLDLPIAKVGERLALAKQVRVLCQAAKHPDLASHFIRDGLSVETVRTTLQVLKAAIDNLQIDGALRPDAGASPKKPRVDTTAVYTRMNQPALKGA